VIEVDIIIVGAGPAGASLALTLAPRRRVLLVDRAAEPAPRIGESLVPAARRLFRDMQILEALEAEGYPAYLGNRSHWGGGPAQVTDFLRDPDGPGWHLDRVGFERFLRAAALQRGARIIAPARLGALERSDAGWDVSLVSDNGETHVQSRLVVDATGRAATMAKRLGVKRENIDRLSAHWISGHATRENSGTAGFSVVESEPEGWWYSAPLADGGRVLAFHGDSDISLSDLRHRDQFLDWAMSPRGLGQILTDIGFSASGEVMVTAANSARLSKFAGDGWLAIGDAAISFDPLASRGLLNALYTGWSGAMACHDCLSGTEPDFSAYASDLENVWSLYRRHLRVVYGAEDRWPDPIFWARRMEA
jgi:flavin-dependent dehydrogenase